MSRNYNSYFCVASVASFVVLTLLATKSHAQVVLFSNFANPAPTNTVNGTQFTTGQTLKSVRFTMGATPYALSSVQATLSLNTGSGSGTALLSLFTDNGGGIPGSLIGVIGSNIVTNSNAGAPQNYTFTPLAPFALQSSMTYHLVMSNPSGTSIRWYRPNPTSLPVAQNGSGIGNFAVPLSSNAGASWDVNSTVYSRIEVSGIVVPEAGSLTLVFSTLGVFCAGIARRRK